MIDSAQNIHIQPSATRDFDLERGLILLKLLSEQQSENGNHKNGSGENGARQKIFIPSKAEWTFIEKHQANPKLARIVEDALTVVKKKNPSLEPFFQFGQRLPDINKSLQRGVHLLSKLGVNGHQKGPVPAKRTGRNKRRKNIVAYRTSHGVCFHGSSEKVLDNIHSKKIKGKVDLIFTSPPFPLNNKKKYGNLQGQKYVDWLASFAPLFKKMLKRNGWRHLSDLLRFSKAIRGNASILHF